jgi:RHS repeat-associated protein
VLGQQVTSITPDIEEGMKPYGSFHGGDIDQVSLSSGKLELNIPLVSYPQRGRRLKLSLWLRWQNPISVARAICTDGVGCTYDSFFANNSDPGLISTNDLLWRGANKGAAPNMHGNYAEATAPDGSTRQMVWTGSAFETIDGSGIRFVGSPGITEDQDGVRFGTTIEEVNGNYITPDLYGTTYADTLGRTIPTPQLYSPTTDYSHCSGPIQPTSANLWTVPAPGGGTETFKFCYAPFSSSYVISVDSQNVAGPGPGTMLESIVLPNNTTWTFQYGPTYPTLSQITLPTGGTISYTWNLFIAPCSYTTHTNPRQGITTDKQSWFFVLASRSVNSNDGSGSHTWTYSGGPFVGSTTGGTAKITDPALNDSVHVMTGLGGTAAVYETQTQLYQGSSSSGTLLKTVTTNYNWSPNPFYQPNTPTSCSTVVNVLPIRVTTAWANGQTTKQETDYDTSLKYGAYSGDSPTITGSYGKPIARREYDYASGAPGPLLRQTKTTYMAFSGPNASSYMANHLLSLPYTAQILNGSGTQVALTTFAYDQTSLTSSGITTQHDNAPPTGTYRGNQTSVSRWVNTTGTNLTSTATFYDTGMAYQLTDPASHTTSYAYSSNFVGAYPTTITNALTQATNYNYDFNTGLHTSTTDPNLLQTSFSYDNMWRLSQVNHPDGGQDIISHQEITTPFTVTLTTKINSTQNLVKANVFDGLGRVTQSQTSASGSQVLVDITYDSLGLLHSTSNPHGTAPAPTDGTTTYVYDAIGRTCVVVPPDGTVVNGSSCPTSAANDVVTSYAGNTSTLTDEAGKSRKSVMDALGHLSQVFEDPSGLNYETDYTYDALDNLLTVNQKGGSTNSSNWRTRTFTYDSLSRSLSTANPESGTITYTYNPDSTLAIKIAPAPNQVGTTTVTNAYSYDALHRVTQKSFSDSTPTVKYGYDGVAPPGCTLPALTIGNGIGERTGMCDAGGAEAWSYDITSNVGWKITDARTTNSVTKSTIAQKNLGGSVAILTYPSGRIVTYAFDTTARPVSTIDSNGPINYATSALYSSAGAMSSVTNGASIVSTYFYNNRLQPCRISVKNGGIAPSACSDSTIGNLLDFTYNFSVGTADNGNVTAITNNRDNTRSQNFTYDSLNRIGTAQTQTTGVTIPNSNCWGFTFGYDPWGNLLTSSITGPAGCSEPIPLNVAVTTSNRISTNTVAGAVTNYCYDAAGNLIHTVIAPATCPTSGPYQYTYNAESQMTLTAGITYTYDGDGKRVQKSSGKLYWYGAGSDSLNETDLAGNTNNASFNEYIFFGGKRIARRDSSSNVNYYFADHLGTARIVANSSGTVLDDSDFYPFGGERSIISSSGNTYKFTAKERDSESGLDNFGARYNASSIGRFMSPDPKNPSFRHLVSPQKWNKYGYVLNNPLALTDPNGFEEQSFLQKLASIFYVKGSVGVAVEIGAEVHVGKAKSPIKLGASIGADVKATGKVTTEGVTVSATKEAGVKVDIGKAVIGPQASQEDVTVKNGQVLSEHEVEKSKSLAIGTEKAEATMSSGEVGAGFEVDAAVLVVGFEVGINTEKVVDLMAPALPPPPATPAPPPPPPCSPGKDTKCP